MDIEKIAKGLDLFYCSNEEGVFINESNPSLFSPLESWNDYSPKKNTYTIAQPTIRPLFDTRSAAESLLIWAGLATHQGQESKNYYEFIKSNWKEFGFPTQTKFTPPESSSERASIVEPACVVSPNSIS